MLTVAIAKGRLQDETLKLFALAGISLSAAALASRRLALIDDSGDFRMIFVKPADVPVYVEHGIADCGVVGRDVLIEFAPDLLEPLAFPFGYCRIAVAALQGRDFSEPVRMLRIATKYPRIAAAHFGALGIPVEIIALTGSVELAPPLGLSDLIVDLVESGKTLAENGLTIQQVITESSARFVVNRASYQLKPDAIKSLTARLETAVMEGWPNAG